MTPPTDQPPPQSLRDLLVSKASGDPYDELRLHRWTREETVIRSALQFAEAYKSTGLQAAHFNAPLHAKLWQAYVNFMVRVDAEEQKLDKGTVPKAHLVSELCDVDPALSGNDANNYLDVVMSDEAVSPKYGLGVLVKELFQHHRNRRWSQNFAEWGDRVARERDTVGLMADAVRMSAGVLYDAQGDSGTCKAINEIDWDPSADVSEALVRTGIEPVDTHAAGGHGRGDLMVIGAGTNVGKSYNAKYILGRQAHMKQRAAYISCEDNYELLYCRMLADYCEPRVSPAAIRQRQVDPEIVMTARRRMNDNMAGRIFIAVAKKPTISKVCEIIRSHRFSKDVDMVIVDYLQAISADEPMTNKVQEMAFVTSALKRTAYECNVALVAYSQLAREQYKDGAEPNINACKYCGDIENESEIMVIMWRDNDGVLHAKIPKVKWAAARDLRYTVPVQPMTGAHGEWQLDTSSEDEDD